MWLYLLQGVGYGLAAASQPGPFQTYLVSQTVTRGWKRTLPAAFAPLISDAPIIAVCLLVLSQVPVWLERFLYIAGGLFILYLAFGTFKSWKSYETQTASPESSSGQSILKAALTIALSPGPYIYWTLVTGPILIKGWRETPVNGIGFLAGFYATIVSSLAALIVIFGVTSKLGPKFSRTLLGVSALALLGFGLYQLWLGVTG
ncbi:MAG: LysE family transporter [Chloroflexi bacterium]|nr:LysE family transporter [Chloroflexota bacterium]